MAVLHRLRITAPPAAGRTAARRSRRSFAERSTPPARVAAYHRTARTRSASSFMLRQTSPCTRGRTAMEVGSVALATATPSLILALCGGLHPPGKLGPSCRHASRYLRPRHPHPGPFPPVALSSRPSRYYGPSVSRCPRRDFTFVIRVALPDAGGADGLSCSSSSLSTCCAHTRRTRAVALRTSAPQRAFAATCRLGSRVVTVSSAGSLDAARVLLLRRALGRRFGHDDLSPRRGLLRTSGSCPRDRTRGSMRLERLPFVRAP